MKANFIIITVMGLLFMSNFIESQESNILDNIIKKNKDQLTPVINHPDKYELQIIFTKINRDNADQPSLNTFSYNEIPDKYFYPASTVKFPAAVLTLEKLNDLNKERLNMFTHLSIDSVYKGHVSFSKDFKNECGYPNIANYIKQIFLVSDNESFNRLYDFLGQKEINSRLQKRGFKNTNIVHRLSVARTSKQNMETNPINFFDKENNLIYKQAAGFDSSDVKLKLKNTIKGKGYFSSGKLVNEPKDFSQNNFFSLRDQHNLMMRIMKPELFSKDQRFNLTEEDYAFLKKYMCMLPKESGCPKYDSTEYYDGYVKFLMFGDTKQPIPENIKIYSKSGLAYGYLTDNVYVVDEKNKIEFFLSATIHVNENGIYNDDKYEYDEIGLPFLAELGRIIYNYEKGRR